MISGLRASFRRKPQVFKICQNQQKEKKKKEKNQNHGQFKANEMTTLRKIMDAMKSYEK
jgi:hypothetical protein